MCFEIYSELEIVFNLTHLEYSIGMHFHLMVDMTKAHKLIAVKLI